ncbi:uncharacterized protein LOC143599027 [Bidens hawaiensis]|uniref:uncharacterized protein LOC143599027 n=1 Tax=Bidens hawaiensis TaxID=980011 RepID=UPI004049CC73
MASDKEEPIIQPKASGGISLQVPKLNGTNYITWAIVVEAILDDQESWEISKYNYAREIQMALIARYVGVERVQKARLLTLKSEFEKLKMAENETVDEFVGKITIMVSKAMSLGHVFEQDVLVKKLLDAVPDKYFELVASIKQSVDLDSLMFEDSVGRPKAFEERLRGTERASNSQCQLLFNRSESNYKGKSHEQSGSRGKGWPSSPGRGKGREIGGQDRDDEDQDGCDNRDGQHRGSRYTGQRRTNDRQWRRKDISQVQCYHCDEFGNFVSMCPERMNKKEESI